MFRQKYFWVISIVLMILVAISGACSTATPTPQAAEAPTTVPPTEIPAADTPEAAEIPTTVPPTEIPAQPTPVPAPVTFIFGNQGEPVCLDPGIMSDGVTARVTNQIFEGLVKYDKDTTNVVPSLAERWEASDDGTVWTFYLRQGVKFHDGTDFNADAVVKNFDYWKNPENPLHAAQEQAGKSFLHFPLEFGGFGDDCIISQVEAVDDYTVKFTLKTPQGPFLQNLAIFAYVLWSPTALETAGIDSCKNPVGTGPFTFVEWKENEYVTLAKNLDYWDTANAAKVDQVIIRNIKDSSARLAALKAGEIHAMEGLNPDDVKAVEADPNLKIMLRPANTISFLEFNFHVQEFQDINVRKAFAQAINKQAIVDNLYGGTGLVATQMQPPALWGYNKDITDWPYDPESAKTLLTEAGFPDGLSEITWEDGTKEPLILWYMPVSRPYYPDPKAIGEAIAADLAKAGIVVQLQTVDWSVYLDQRKNGTMDFFMLGGTGNNGDPDDFLGSSFCLDAEDNPKPTEGFVYNKELSDMLKRAKEMIVQSERAPIYQQAEQIVHDDVLRIFIANNQPPLAFSNKVEGYIPNPTSTEFFNTVSIVE